MQPISIRALIAVLIALLSSSVLGEPVAERKPWHAVIPSPRAGLPAVTIDFGYPGPYIPMLNAPIAIRATANDVPFDGYIGFHFAVGDRGTLDTPVIARATLRPHESWSFTTTASRRWDVLNISARREIGVEWRDSAMQKIASRSTGVPPWTSWDDDLLPLRVVASDAEMSTVDVLGSKPYVERANALPDQAQWYTGFSAVVIPVATWLDLPASIREAIFGSGRFVVFFGFPRVGQPIERLDRILLPVAFSARPGSYDAPWPYRDSRQMPAAAPFSWTAKDGADKIGPDQNPYIVRTNAAAWVADETALTRPLPAMARIGKRRPLSLNSLELEANINWSDETRRHFMSMVAKHDFLQVYSGAIAAIAAIVLAIVAWILLRKTPRVVVVISAVLAATILFAERSHIRPASDVRDYDIRAPIAPGIIDHFHVWRAYGPAPLAGPAPIARTSITGDYGKWASAEVRTSETPISMGLLRNSGDWDAVSRWSYQRELDATSTSFGNRAMAAPASGDFHSPIGFSLVDRTSNSGWSRLMARPKMQPGAICTFALPSGVRAARMTITFNGSQAELKWSSGSTKLTLAKKDLYTSPSVEIPPAVLREIVAHGGIVDVTFARPAEHPFDQVWIAIRESKS